MLLSCPAGWPTFAQLIGGDLPGSSCKESKGGSCEQFSPSSGQHQLDSGAGGTDPSPIPSEHCGLLNLSKIQLFLETLQGW